MKTSTFFITLCLSDMVDYDGENRYYGEGIREKLFAKPYRNWLTFDHEFYCIIFNRLKETIVLDKCTTLM